MQSRWIPPCASAEISLASVPRPGSPDPFDALPKTLSPRLAMLIDHCMSTSSSWKLIRFALYSTVLPTLTFPQTDLHFRTKPSLLIFEDNHVFVQNPLPVNTKSKWLNYALSDPALFQATLLISAVHLALLHGGILGEEVFYHKGETIRLVNNRLRDPEQGATDGTIGAVACLTIIEVSSRPICLSLIYAISPTITISLEP